MGDQYREIKAVLLDGRGDDAEILGYRSFMQYVLSCVFVNNNPYHNVTLYSTHLLHCH